MPVNRPMPEILIYECKNTSIRSGFKYLACIEQKANGELLSSFYDPTFEKLGKEGREFLVSRERNQWVGSTAEIAKAKAIEWWTGITLREQEMEQERISRFGQAAVGTTWLVNKTTKHRVRAKNEEVDEYLAKGYEPGKIL